MASYEKRSGGWRVKVRVAGVSKSGTFPTKAAAASWAQEQEANAKSTHADGIARGHRLHQALVKYADEVSPTKRGKRWEQIRLAALQEMLPDEPLI